MNDVTGEEMPVSGHCFSFLILSCLSQTDVKQSGRVRLQNSAKILLLDPHLAFKKSHCQSANQLEGKFKTPFL